jgi:phosphoglucomutase
MSYLEEYKRWLGADIGPVMIQELKDIEDNDEEIRLRFFNALQFGTAGLRSVTGAGISRMNIYTVGKATQGLCAYILAESDPEAGMVVAYDPRNSSEEFAKRTCEVLAGNGIKTYLFEGIASVPELSYAIRRLKAFGGVMITASHNPKEYNGYKVYAAYGGQLSIDASAKVTEFAAKADLFTGVKSISFAQAVKENKIHMLGQDIRDEYYQKLMALITCRDEIQKYCGEVKVVYTPLYGTGLRTMKNIAQMLHIEHFYIVEEQATSDGNFPTVKMPNPEDKTAMVLALKLAEEKNADIAMGTDPDADRMGAAIRDKNGQFVMLTGNQIGCLLLAHILETRQRAGKRGGFIIKSIVSTNMADAIAAAYGVPCFDVLTGFRFIAELATEKEAAGEEFVFGFEESYGYLAGSHSRDKDGTMAAMLLTELLCCCRAQGVSITEKLYSLYEKYGYYAESVESKVFAGLNGMDEMKAVMNAIRGKDIKALAGLKINNIEDYLSQKRTYADGKTETIDLPVSDVLKFNFEGGSWASARPSGTEPKLKIYFNAKENSEAGVAALILKLKEEFMKLI